MAEATAEAVPATAKKKSPVRLVLILVGAVVLLGGGAAGAYLMLSHKGGGAHEGKAAEEKAAEGKASEAPAKGEGAGESYGVLSLEPFIVNLADDGGDRYVKCTMRLVLDHQAVADAAKTDDLTITRIRDRVLTLLSSKAFAQVATPDGKESLRKEIQAQVNTILKSASVTEVYYTEFIVQ
jgi:flagellar protein FliL